MTDNEEIIVNIMQKAGCKGQENMITPDKLAEECAAKGLTDSGQMQAAIISLVDQDVIDYEMDDDLQTSELWLL